MNRGLLVGAIFLSSFAIAQDDPLTKEAYLVPPKEIQDLVLAPRWQNGSLSNSNSDLTKYILTQSGGMPPLSALGKPYYNLAGLQIDPVAFRARSLTIGGSKYLKIFDLINRKSSDFQVPSNVNFSNARWSPNGQLIAFMANFEDGTRICVADVSNGKSRVVSKRNLLATAVTSFEWTPDSENIV